MKSLIKLLLLLPLLFFSCSKLSEVPIVDNPVEMVREYGFNHELTVPVGTSVVFVEYGNKNISIPVTPEVIVPEDGKGIEPFGTISLNLVSPVKTAFNAYYTINEERIDLIENGLVNEPIVATKSGSGIVLDEPEPYKDGDPGFTTYHSSGVVMFEDSWPISEIGPGKGRYDTDFNDLVLDYDIEAITVADEFLASQGWREQVKVVLHLRASSASEAQGCDTEVERVGLILEGFNIGLVDDLDGKKWIESYCSFDSWQNPHGELPGWTKETLQRKSIHNEDETTRPYVEIGSIQSTKDPNSGAGTEEYTRKCDKESENFTTVFNPGLKPYWSKPKEEQYSSDLEDLYKFYKYTTLAKTLKSGYYNVVPGYVNVGGGLYTYTVIYHMKNRADMSDADRKVAFDNMYDAVYKTTNQNFYIVNTDGTPVGLMGYTPVDKVAYDAVAKDNDKVDPEVYYKNKDGHIWAFKCPTRTKHMWNKLPFSAAYPHYMNWVDTKGAEDADWYYKDTDGRLMSCWW